MHLGWALSASTLEAHLRRQVDCSGGTTRAPLLWLRSRSPCWHQGPAPPWVRSLANHDCFACGRGRGCVLDRSMCVYVYIYIYTSMYLHMFSKHTWPNIRTYRHNNLAVATGAGVSSRHGRPGGHGGASWVLSVVNGAASQLPTTLPSIRAPVSRQAGSVSRLAT